MTFRFFVLSIVVFIGLTGCSSEQQASSEGKTLEKVILMTDWYPQPEHGGFYQAKARGFYTEAGLDVEIRPGGGVRDIRPLVALNQVNFAIGTSDTTLIGRTAGLPLKSLAPFFQHDPQCIMFYSELGIDSLSDLDGKVVMMQASLSQAEYMTKIMGLNLKLIPLDYSIARFAQDRTFAQQCFITSEPIALATQGIEPEVILLSESGFDPYRHIYSSEQFVSENPEITKKFVEASVKGWSDYIANDPTPGLLAIMEDNPQQKMETMLLALDAMKKHSLVTGKPDQGDIPGVYSKERLDSQIQTLKELKLISDEITVEQAFAEELLPDQYR